MKPIKCSRVVSEFPKSTLIVKKNHLVHTIYTFQDAKEKKIVS